MGRFTVVRMHRVLGTDRDVYIMPMSAVSSRSFRESALAALAASAHDEKESVMEVLQAKLDVEPQQYAAIATHVFDDADMTVPTFADADQVSAELADFQIDDLFAAINDRSGFTKEAADLATRFQDNGDGEAGSVPSPPDGGEVRATPQRDPDRYARTLSP